jgi:hypothetical protein
VGYRAEARPPSSPSAPPIKETAAPGCSRRYETNHRPIPILGILQKNIFKKWQIFSAQNHVLKSPQFTINPPQTHHEFTSKKHHIFANPLQKTQKIGENPSGRARQKKSQNQIRRR